MLNSIPSKNGRRISGTLLISAILALGFTSALLVGVPSDPPVHAETLGAWSPTSVYPDYADPGWNSCAISGGYIYCVGGFSGSTNAEFSTVSSSGFGGWMATTSYPITPGETGIGIVASSCVASDGYIYCVGGLTTGSGGESLDSVYYAPLSSSGIGTWVATSDYPSGENSLSCAVSGGYIYCVGGAPNGPGVSDEVYYASISSSGVGAWAATTSYPIPIYTQTCAIAGAYLYCVGGDTESSSGYSGTGSVYYAPISPAGVGVWTSTTSYPDSAGGQVCAISSYNYLYCVGGTPDSPGSYGLTRAYYAPASATGVGAWVPTTSFPMGTSWVFTGGCPISGNYIYCVIDSVGSETSSYYASISSPLTTSQLTVDTVDTSNQTISGYYTVLYQNGTTVGNGFSPTTFTLNTGQTYVVQVDDYGSCHFDHWADTGSTDPQRTITAASTDLELTAVYSCATTSTSTIDIAATNGHGSPLVGYYATLSTAGGTLLQSCYSPCSFTVNGGQTYQVTVANYAGEVFSHWSDNAGTVNAWGGSRTVDVPATSMTISLTAVFSP